MGMTNGKDSCLHFAYSDGGEDRDRKINNVTNCLSRNKEYTSARLRINR